MRGPDTTANTWDLNSSSDLSGSTGQARVPVVSEPPNGSTLPLEGDFESVPSGTLPICLPQEGAVASTQAVPSDRLTPPPTDVPLPIAEERSADQSIPEARPEPSNSTAAADSDRRVAKSRRATARSSRRRAREVHSESPSANATEQTATVPGTGGEKSTNSTAATDVSTNNASNRYSRVSELGRGGWGVVERAVDHQLQREVAVKRLGANIDGNTEIRNRFLHEAKVTSQLQHPSIVPVHELGVGGEGEAYYVMKLLEGSSLRDHIRSAHQALEQQGTAKSYQLREVYLPLLDRFIDVCHAVAYAHRRGVIHRDLKPANVMVGEFGETIVVDWGLAKHLHQPPETRLETQAEAALDPYGTLEPTASIERPPIAASQHYEVTQSGSVIGTPAYMPPEQASGNVAALGPQSDIYSLGVMLFEIVGGRVPLNGCDVETMLARVCSGDVPRLRQLQPSAPRALEAVCAVAMAQAPEQRYATAEQLAEDVRRFIAGDAISVYRDPWRDRVLRWCRRHQALAMTISTSVCVLLLASLVFGGIIQRAHQAERQARVEAQAAHRTAIGRLAQARDSADSWLLDLSGALEFYPGLSPLREDLLRKAIAQYTALADEDVAESTVGCSDPRLRAHAMLEAARAKIRLGDLYRIGSAQNGPSHDPRRYYENAKSLLADAFAQLEQAEDAATQEDIVADIRLEQVNALIGCILVQDSDATLLVAALHEPAGEGTAQVELAQLERWLQAQLSSVRSSADAQQGPAREQAKVNEHSCKLASAYVRLKLASGRMQGASGGNRAARTAAERVDTYRAAATWARWLADYRGTEADLRLAETTLTDLISALNSIAATDEALHARQSLIDDLQRWTGTNPARADLLQSMAYAKMTQAEQLASLRQDAEAAGLYRNAVGDLTRAWELLDAESFFRINLAVANHNLAQLAALRAVSDPTQLDTAKAQLVQSITTYETLLRQEVTEDGLRRLCQSHTSMAELLALMGSDALAEKEHWNAAELGYQMLVDHELATHDDLIEKAACCVGAANLSWKNGDDSDAQLCLERAAEALDLAKHAAELSSFRGLEVKLRWIDVSAKLSQRRGAVAEADALRNEYRRLLLSTATRERDASNSAKYPVAMQRWVDYVLEQESQQSPQETFDRATLWQQAIEDLYPECRQSAEWWQREATRCIIAGRFDEARTALEQCQQLRDGDLLDATLLLLLDSRQKPQGDAQQFEFVRSAVLSVPNHRRLHFWYAQLLRERPSP